ncbi:MAG: serpin family protein [Desulfosarcinaceae bacterium]
MRWQLAFLGLVWGLAGLCLIAPPVAAGGIPLPPTGAPVGDYGFALALFQTLARLQPPANLLVSPLSVYTALMMTASGARGATRTAMAGGLGYDPAAQTAAESQLAAYLAQVEAAAPAGAATGDPAAIFNLANAIWTSADTPLKPEYVTAMRDRFRAEVKSLPATHPAEAINAWVSERTRGKIDHMVDQVDSELTLLLINAAYFKAAWQTPFPLKATTEGPFFRTGKKVQEVAYMTRRGQFDYLAAGEVQLVSLPYRDARFRMLLLLPAREVPLDAFIASLNGERLDRWRRSMRRSEGRVSLPRFQLSAGFSLKKPLSEMGMQTAFDGERADFGGITAVRPFAIGGVRHRCVLTVDEVGSEAAAATAVEMFGAAPPMGEPFDFRAERPFLCLLEDQTAGRILFMAAVFRPAAP